MFGLQAHRRVQPLLYRAAAKQRADRDFSLCITFLLFVVVPCAICTETFKKSRITREDYYQDLADIPNRCSITFHSTRSHSAIQSNGSSIVPFIGTPLVRDSQLLLLRLYYSIDYPVKYFIVVVSEKAWDMTLGALGYQLQHLKEYGQNVVVITCQHPPAVAEGWNASKHHLTSA